MSPRVTTIILGCALSLAGPVFAADEPTPQERAEHATRTRQGVFELIVHYFVPMAGMARGLVPYDADVVRGNSTKISHLADMITDQFELDTREFRVETEALEHIWDSKPDFSAKAVDLRSAAVKLASAAGKDQQSAIKSIKDLSNACRACHTEYRED